RCSSSLPLSPSSLLSTRPLPSSPLFPYTTLFRSQRRQLVRAAGEPWHRLHSEMQHLLREDAILRPALVLQPDLICHPGNPDCQRSEEHTSELQSRFDLVCRLLLEKKN